jgi:dolichol-phosphate mannosyltransferase
MGADPAISAGDQDYATSPLDHIIEDEPPASTAGRRAVMALNYAAEHARPRLSIVVPTRNEEGNVGPLLDRLASVLSPGEAEVIVVDDSSDATPQALADCAVYCPLPVSLLHRPAGARHGGLSTAVIAGAREARGDWVLVMDADLQHPPEAAAMLAKTAMRHDANIVVGTRYAGGGSSADGLARPRARVSNWATRLAKSVFPRRLAMVSDPLSGLFAFQRASVDLDRLKPAGFKILFEILVRNPVAKVAEVAYCFGPRHAGRSKASARQGLIFLQHLARLRCARMARQLREGPQTRAGRMAQAGRFLAFGLVGLSGVAVNTAVLWFCYDKLGWNHLVGASLATQASTTWNFLLVDTLIYRKRAHGTRLGRAVRFFLMNNLLLIGRLPVLQALVTLGIGVLTANAITLVLLFLVRFVVSDRAIFGSGTQDKARDPVRILVDLTAVSPNGKNGRPGESSRKRARYLPYRYDIAGVVTIGSQITLPELEFFRAQWVPDWEVDIAVRVGDVGSRSLRKRAAMTESTDPAAMRYEEHLGRIGANFRVHLGDPISVEVGPLLARSCHVVYTNIIEPLLRFVMVSRGRMLLHAACVEIGGTGVMLSALTDTGKTGTVLRLLREHGGRFLSDDMTVIDARGNAYCFPKPLTISAHTLRAVQADDLTRSEWRRLQFQSRLHSKGGRSIGLTLSRFNLPIMGINALTQILIPPPKYSVDRLVPCRMASACQVRELFIIERGQDRLAELDHDSALRQLITNTDDAYGFPPFRYLAPAIKIGGQDYHQLRAAEREILSSFLRHPRMRVLASDTFGWADEIPVLVRPEAEPAFSAPDALPEQQRWDAQPSGDEQLPDGRRDLVGARRYTAAAGPDVPLAPEPPTGSPPPVIDPVTPPPPPPVPTSRTSRGAAWARILSQPLPLAVVLGLAVFLRFWQLSAIGFNSDEAVYTGSAASIAGDPTLQQLFPVFRAHPLLFQTLLSLVLRVHDTDWTARAFAATIGVATVALTFVLGRRLYGPVAGLLAALLLAVMPYHMIVSRQVLLDGLMTLCATAALYCVIRYVETARLNWLLAAGSMMGAAILSKETSVVMLGGLYAFFVLTPSARMRGRHLALASLLLVAEVAIWPVMLRLAGRAQTGHSYLLWQIFRRPNHGTWFYFSTLPSWIGPALLAAALAGLLWLRQEGTWRERLLLTWLIVPLIFFTLWPVKGFQYLLPISPPLAVLAARTLAHPLPIRGMLRLPGWRHARPALPAGRAAMGLLAAATVVSLVIPAWNRIEPATTTTFLAGSGGLSGGRQAGRWVLHHLPAGARLLAIGPSTANVLEFYGHHPVSALSVSSDPRDRNPSYLPVANPDLALRRGVFQYIVWDAYTASRTPFFSAKARRLTSKYHGVAVFTATIKVPASSGPAVSEPAFIIYKVHP